MVQLTSARAVILSRVILDNRSPAVAAQNQHSMNLAYIVTRGEDLGGAQVHVRDLCIGLLALGHQVTVLAGGEGVFTEELTRTGVPWNSVPQLAVPVRPVRDTVSLIALTRALRRLRPDLVLAHNAKAGMLGRVAGALLGIPAVYTPHGWAITDRVSSRQGVVYRVLERAAARITARIVNVCHYEFELARQHRIAAPEKMAVVHNGLTDIAERFRAAPERQPPRIVMVARMAPPKDHATLLKALSGLTDLDWILDLVGGGPGEDAHMAMAEALGLSGRVRFCSFRRDIEACLAEAQVAVLSSVFEAFPYVVLEAMRAGLPVVASRVGGIPEAVVDGVTGFLAPARDPEALRDCLARLIRDPGLRRRMGAAGRQRFLDLFTLDRMIASTVQVYRDVMRAAPLFGTILTPENRALAPRQSDAVHDRRINSDV